MLILNHFSHFPRMVQETPPIGYPLRTGNDGHCLTYIFALTAMFLMLLEIILEDLSLLSSSPYLGVAVVALNSCVNNHFPRYIWDEGYPLFDK